MKKINAKRLRLTRFKVAKLNVQRYVIGGTNDPNCNTNNSKDCETVELTCTSLGTNCTYCETDGDAVTSSFVCTN